MVETEVAGGRVLCRAGGHLHAVGARRQLDPQAWGTTGVQLVMGSPGVDEARSQSTGVGGGVGG